MTSEELLARVRNTIKTPMPLPGGGHTAQRHRRLMETGREDLSIARLAEAHWDAVAILAESGREPVSGALYGVWASEIPGHELRLERGAEGFVVSGMKRFCSGAGLVDRALVTVGAAAPQLVDLDLRRDGAAISFDSSGWKTEAFAETRTYTGSFAAAPVMPDELVGDAGWYLSRIGFWHGALGPAACWAGGAVGLMDYALAQHRNDAHTLAHLGAMWASVWALKVYLEAAGREIDEGEDTPKAARIRALTVRHMVEQACTDMLRRLPRAYGPSPLALDADAARRYHELDLYLRQCHAERDLESLGCDVRAMSG